MPWNRAKTVLSALCLSAALGLTAASTHAQSQDTTIFPGYWEYRIKAAGLTVDTQFWCVKPDQVDKFFTGPCNRHHTCVYPVREVGDGKARFEGYWMNDDGKRANISASGTYTLRQFILRTRATRGTNGVPIPPLTLEANWRGETCKPGARTPR